DCRLVGSWTTAASMAEPRAFYSATLLDDGRVLVAGGFVRTNGIGPPLGGHYSAGAEIYDPTSETWSPTGQLATGRAGHAAVLLDDGRVLVAGGFSGTVRAPIAYVASAEIYDPVSNTWTATGSMTMPRADAEGVRLENGQVMAIGGNTAISVPATRTNTAEIYDPATGQWRLTGGAMSDPKVDHAVTLLKDCQVLAAGGRRTNDTEVASADLYNPSTDTWTPEPSMSRARGGIFAVTLEDGRVLVVGGENEDPNTLPDNALASAEIFTEPPARVESVVVNDGSAQRSMVNSLTVTFDQ